MSVYSNICTLSDNDKAAAINLALFLDVRACDERLLKEISKKLANKKGEAILEFWRELSSDTQRVYLCVMDYMGRI